MFSLEIVRSWFSLVDEDGWIGREQILGPEARSKVPVEFQVQYPHYANPPTLFLVFEALIDKLDDKSAQKSTSDPLDRIRSAHLQHPELAIIYLKDLYPLLKRHYYWYRKTQWGDIKSYDRVAFSPKEAYRWRGRTPQHILTSGLDDYPRPQPPHPGELHTDLISWMGMMTRSMRRVAETIGESEDAEEFKGYETAIIRNIDDLHWSQKHQTYCDATIDDYEESVHVCHKGYISIFPFLTGLVAPNSPRLGPILDLISDREELWSDYGLRSLSLKDEFYGTEENYWRSPVWMNINYMAVKSLLVRPIPVPDFFGLSLALRKRFFSKNIPFILHSLFTANVPFFIFFTQRLTEQKDRCHHPSFALPESSRETVHLAPYQPRTHRLRRMGAHRLCLGAVQPRNGPGPADPAFHRLDQPGGEDYGHAGSQKGGTWRVVKNLFSF